MPCDFCGASYPAGGYCPHSGTGPARNPGFLPLAGFADVLVLLLGLLLGVTATTSASDDGAQTWPNR